MTMARRRPRSAAGYAFVAGYVVLLIAFGVAPTVWALTLAFQKSTAGGGFAGVSNFVRTFEDYRFLPAIEHTGLYLLIWLVSLITLVVGLALGVHARGKRSSSVLRVVYYLPGALAGAAGVVVWLFLLDPAVSPIGFILRAFGWTSLNETVAAGHLPYVFAMMAFWSGAGGWILVMYGALNTIPAELMDAAGLDGCSAWQLAIRIKVPMIRKWIAYMVILAFATGSQLFVEPQLVGEASFGVINPSWSPNQLAYVYAFQMDNFNGSAAIAVDLLVLGLLCAALVVVRTGLFRAD